MKKKKEKKQTSEEHGEGKKGKVKKNTLIQRVKNLVLPPSGEQKKDKGKKLRNENTQNLENLHQSQPAPAHENIGEILNEKEENIIIVKEVSVTKNSIQKEAKKDKIKADNRKRKTENDELLNVSEIFYSIQGESTYAGLPCVFVRLQGCNLRCSWCDTEFALNAKKERKRLSSDEIIGNIKKYDCKYVCITGGEPLMQKKTSELLSLLCNNGFSVSLETNGFYSLGEIDKRVSKIVDFKCPGSKMQKKNNFANLEFLTKKDEIKFVIKDREDYKWARSVIIKNKLPEKVNSVLMSPVFGKLEPKQLSRWILKDDLKVRVQFQLHKYIWNPKKRGV